MKSNIFFFSILIIFFTNVLIIILIILIIIKIKIIFIIQIIIFIILIIILNLSSPSFYINIFFKKKYGPIINGSERKILENWVPSGCISLGS